MNPLTPQQRTDAFPCPPESDGGALVNEGGKLVIRRASYALRKGSDGYEHVIYEKQYWNATVSAWGLDIRDATEYQPAEEIERLRAAVKTLSTFGVGIQDCIEACRRIARDFEESGYDVTIGAIEDAVKAARLTNGNGCP